MQNARAVFDKNLFQLEAAHHKDKPIIWVKFQKDFNLIALLKTATNPAGPNPKNHGTSPTIILTETFLGSIEKWSVKKFC